MPKYTNNDYDIEKAFKNIEDELISSMMRNLDHHRAMETDEGIQWEQWQVKQLEALEKYKRLNKKKFTKQFSNINDSVGSMIKIMRDKGGMSQEIKILKAIKRGYNPSAIPQHMRDFIEQFKGKSLKEIINIALKRNITSSTEGAFFRLNTRKLEALIEATKNDFDRAERAMLRMSNDQYRKIIFNAQVYANTGAGTYEKAVDMATKDFLSSGINCIEYKNGSRHTISDYADMAIRTAGKRAYLTGEGEVRKEWGISTVIVNKRGNPCPLCLPFCGKVLIDDVWSGGKASDGPYKLMSSAMAAGLYHPRCKDAHTTYFEGISTPPDDEYSKKELEEIKEVNSQEAKQQYAERQAEKFKRLSKYSLDTENQEIYNRKSNLWKRVRFRTGDMTSKEYAATKEATMRNYRDVTEEWLKNAVHGNGKVEELLEYTVDNVTYKVNGKTILLDYKEGERKIAELLKEELGGEISMVPRVTFPQNISTPDYIFRGNRYDLKEPVGSGKNVISGMVRKKKNQANNFIFDISKCPLEQSEILRQITDLFRSPRTSFINNIIIIENGKIVKIYEKK